MREIIRRYQAAAAQAVGHAARVVELEDDRERAIARLVDAERELREVRAAIGHPQGTNDDWSTEGLAQALRKECFGLAADQCHDGYGDDGGNHRCRYQDRIEELEARLER